MLRVRRPQLTPGGSVRGVAGAGWVMVLWVVYDHPADFPEHWVVRRTVIGRGGTVTVSGEVWLRPTLQGAREVIAVNHPDGYRMDPDPGDDPVIAEVWI